MYALIIIIDMNNNIYVVTWVNIMIMILKHVLLINHYVKNKLMMIVKYVKVVVI